MARHLVCLTFDFDTVTGWMARDLTSPTLISRGEFGLVGAERLRVLLSHHEIRSSWYIPGLTIDTFPDACRAIAHDGHEIAHHGYEHIAPAGLSREEEATQLERGNEAIHRIAGKYARGYRSPSWDLSPHTVDLLLEHEFLYDSSMMGHDYLPYHARTGDLVEPGKPIQFGETTSLVELPISWSVDDYPHFEFERGRGLRAAASVLENWLDDYIYMTEIQDWGVLTYTCHPFVIGRGHRMKMLERLIVELKERGAIFVTAEEAVAEFSERVS